jgi:vacuolar-type H+-ATPase subunit H
MREVIQQLVAVEAEAQRIVQAAQADADRILADAQHQAQEWAARGREDARGAAEKLVATAVANAGREKQARLALASEEIDTQVRLDEEATEQIVTEIVRCVTCGH